MTTCEEILAYIAGVDVPPHRFYGIGPFDVTRREAEALVREFEPSRAVRLAFRFGKAKGYQQAMLEVRKRCP